jgi:feruloyl-CoA synthase
MIPDLAACGRALQLSHVPSHEELAHDANLLEQLRTRLRAHALENVASTRCVRRALLLPSAPSLDRGEITDKGSINQRVVLRHRADLLGVLYAPARAGHVIDIDDVS